jgi:hypothetical protein
MAVISEESACDSTSEESSEESSELGSDDSRYEFSTPSTSSESEEKLELNTVSSSVARGKSKGL